jgi:VCBS repeat-containing protein
VTNTWDLRENGTYTFSVAATGEGVSVLRDGVAMSGADGIYTFQHSGDRTTTQIAISCDGASSAIIRGFNRIVGFSIILR